MKKSTGMRMVGLNNSTVWVQSRLGDKWEQAQISRNAFEVMMQISFPQYVEEYAVSGTNEDMADYFWHYGETSKMIRTGEAYIFTPTDNVIEA